MWRFIFISQINDLFDQFCLVQLVYRKLFCMMIPFACIQKYFILEEELLYEEKRLDYHRKLYEGGD